MNAILSYLLNAAPEIALALIIGFIAWKVSKRLAKTNSHFAKIDDAISDIDDAISDLQKDVTAIKNDVADVQLFITSKYPTALGMFVTKNSPLALNEFGKKLYEECGGKSFLEANQVLLLKKIEEKYPKTALDVETYAKEVLFSLTQNDIFNTIKVWVYNSPAWKIGDKDYTITLGDVCFVLSIPLRDKYLSLHPEIAQ